MFPWRHFKLESLTAHSAETTPQHREWWHKLVEQFRPSKVIRVLLMCVCVHVWTMNQSFNLAADEAANNPAETGRRRRERAVKCEAKEDQRLNYNVNFLPIKWIFHWLLIISRSQIETAGTQPWSAQVTFKSNNLKKKKKKEAPKCKSDSLSFNAAQMFIEFEQYRHSAHYQRYSWGYLYLFVSLSTRRQLTECLRQ